MQSLITTTCDGLDHPELKQQWWDWSETQPFAAMTGWFKNQPVAIVRLFDVRLQIPGAVSVDCIGIGGVFVAEAHRGNAFGRQIVNRALMQFGCRAKPFVLRARIGTMYKTLGFHQVGQDGAQGIWLIERGPVKVFESPLWKLSARF